MEGINFIIFILYTYISCTILSISLRSSFDTFKEVLVLGEVF